MSDTWNSRTALAAPLRAVITTIAIVFALGMLVALSTERYWNVAAGLAGIVCALLARRLAAQGHVQLAASTAFYAFALVLSVVLWFGSGTQGYAVIGYAFVLFLGCVFLAPGAYWGLAACVLASATVLGVAEIYAWLPNTVGPRQDLRHLARLWLIVGACAAGGRALMHMVRASLAREIALSGELRSSRDRMQKIFHSSQNAIVVSRLADGTYLEVNDAYLAMFGYSREDVIGRSALELGVWDDRRERERFVRQIREHKALTNFETKFRKRSGEVFEAELSAEMLDVDGEDCLVVSVADVTAQRFFQRQAEYVSTRDALTGLPRRAPALERLQHGLERARIAGEAIAILQINLDGFNTINDTVGRVAGDAILRDACSRLEALLRGGDTLARTGGDEFLLIADSLPQAADAERLALRVMAAFEPVFAVEGRTLRISCSVGVCIFPGDGADPETLLRHADIAMHVAKSEGRGRFRRFDQVMGARMRDRLFLEASLREGIAGRELRLAYQPKFDMHTGAITGVEALSRWTHLKLGVVPPAHFIAVAEESDLILELGEWVLRESCAQIALWREQGLSVPPVAVNLSARQIAPDLPGLLVDCARERDVAPGLLELEITETMLIGSPEAARRVLEQVTSNGNLVTLDDFGVGYSSLSYVKLLHLSSIKIDRSFVGNVTSSLPDKAIVSAIVGLAHGLGFRVIAEGIESEAQLHVLRDLGCDEAQGFHLGRPQSGEQVASELLATRAGL